jgi:hypothetical protein
MYSPIEATTQSTSFYTNGSILWLKKKKLCQKAHVIASKIEEGGFNHPVLVIRSHFEDWNHALICIVSSSVPLS